MPEAKEIMVTSGVSAFDGSGYCQVLIDGKAIGQLTPDETRDMALNFLGAAEAAESDALVWGLLREAAGMSEELAAAFLREMRKRRE